MDQGKVAQWGTPSALLLNPAGEFVRSFFQEGRLELELRVVRIKDAWALLPEPEREPDGPLPTLDGELHAASSLWEVLQKTNKQQGGKVRIHWEGHTRTITSADLMTAFHRYKDKLPEDKLIMDKLSQ
jgi:ABC-type proline/glycine betaine transport system ATPase subunit